MTKVQQSRMVVHRPGLSTVHISCPPPTPCPPAWAQTSSGPGSCVLPFRYRLYLFLNTQDDIVWMSRLPGATTCSLNDQAFGAFVLLLCYESAHPAPEPSPFHVFLSLLPKCSHPALGASPDPSTPVTPGVPSLLPTPAWLSAPVPAPCLPPYSMSNLPLLPPRPTMKPP